MTDHDYTAIQVLVDRSGSMLDIKDDAEGALKAFFHEQADVPGRATVRLAQFDVIYETVYPSTLVSAVPEFKLQPRGGTALNDAIGRAIYEFGDELSDMHELSRPGVVIFVIITDGQENSSKEFTTERVREMVEHQQSQFNWKFVFLAANQDAVLTGAGYGIQRGSTMTFAANTAGVRASTQSLGAYTTATRAGQTYDFSAEEREAASQEPVKGKS